MHFLSAFGHCGSISTIECLYVIQASDSSAAFKTPRSLAHMNRKERRASAKLAQRPSSAPAAPASTSAPLFEAALRHHQAGRVGEAEACYRRLLLVEPQHAGAAFNLATALKQQNKLAEAAAAYRAAIAFAPDNADAHYNLGNTLMGLQHLDDAVAAYRAAIERKPDLVQAYANLGVALRMQGQLDQAAIVYRRAIAIKPNYAEACSNLGNVLKDQGKLDEAVIAYRQALSMRPDNAEAFYNLGNVLNDQRRHAEAITAYRQAIALRGDHADAYYNLGNILRDQGELDAAVAVYRHAARCRPGFLRALANLGNALSAQGQIDAAIAAYGEAVSIDRDNAEVRYNLGNALKDKGALADAAAAYRAAISIKPAYADAHANLGIVLTQQGELDAALAAYRTALICDPRHIDAHSNLLFALNYNADAAADRVFAEHRNWDAQHAAHLRRFSAYANAHGAGRRLRVGYVSPDFRAHSVAYFFEPLLAAHDRQVVEVFCYAEVPRRDRVTERISALAEHWVSSVGMLDDALAERIHTDGIDILVDLAGHTAHNRPLVFARKPAPLQVTWLGYPNTTGLQAIDYRLVDPVTDPPGQSDACSSEQLVRLDGLLCYAGAADAPEPTPPPCVTSGTITFGSFNNPAKISAATLDAWAAVLTPMPQARLLLKGKPFADAATRALYLARLQERGIAEGRVTLDGWASSSAGHLARYNEIDIALDTFPYNGTT